MMAMVNDLSHYSRSDEQIESWTKSVKEYCYLLTPQILSNIMRKFLHGVIPFDYRLGIVNITKAYRDELQLEIKQPYLKEKDPERFEALYNEIKRWDAGRV